MKRIESNRKSPFFSYWTALERYLLRHEGGYLWGILTLSQDIRRMDCDTAEKSDFLVSGSDFRPFSKLTFVGFSSKFRRASKFLPRKYFRKKLIYFF